MNISPRFIALLLWFSFFRCIPCSLARNKNALLPQSHHRRQRPRLGGARRQGLRQRQLRRRHLDLEGRRLHCTGKPVGVIRSKKPYTNFELVVQWQHLKSGGNSGIFVWTTRRVAEGLKKGQLPKGIEVQVLDHGYAEQYEKNTGKKADWFTTNGDVFPVGVKMKPFAPISPDGSRSFPRKNLAQGSRRVEPLLRPRHQRRSPPVGQRRGSLRRQRLRARQRLPLPGIGRLAGRVQEHPDSRIAVK